MEMVENGEPVCDAACEEKKRADAEKQRADEAEKKLAEKEEADRKKKEEDDRKAMAATAAKLYAGIGAAPLTATGDGQRSAAYSGTGDSEITVTYDPDLTQTGDTAVTETLTEDKKAMEADNYGWEGKKYTDAPGGASVEAIVYSDVEDPTPGRKFGSAEPGTGDNRAYEYTLAAGVLTNANAGGVGGSAGFVAARVGFTNVTRTAGTETFKLPDGRPQGETIINIPGSYHGVSGTYACAPADAAAGCSATVAARGFTVSAGDTWTFKPGSAEARVMSDPDTMYASYGWWLQTSADGKSVIASAFVDYKGGDDSAEFAGGIRCLEWIGRNTLAARLESTLFAVPREARTTPATSPHGPLLKPTSLTTEVPTPSPAPSTTSSVRTASHGIGP